MVDFWQRMLWSAERFSHSVEWFALGILALLSFKWFARDVVFFHLKQKSIFPKRKRRVWVGGYICRVAPGLAFYAPSSAIKGPKGPSVMVDTCGAPFEIDREEIERTIDFLNDILEGKVKAPAVRFAINPKP